MQADSSNAISLFFGLFITDMYWKTDYDLYQDSIEQLVYSPPFLSFAEFGKVFYELYPDFAVLCHIRL